MPGEGRPIGFPIAPESATEPLHRKGPSLEEDNGATYRDARWARSCKMVGPWLAAADT